MQSNQTISVSLLFLPFDEVPAQAWLRHWTHLLCTLPKSLFLHSLQLLQLHPAFIAIAGPLCARSMGPERRLKARRAGGLTPSGLSWKYRLSWRSLPLLISINPLIRSELELPPRPGLWRLGMYRSRSTSFTLLPEVTLPPEVMKIALSIPSVTFHITARIHRYEIALGLYLTTPSVTQNETVPPLPSPSKPSPTDPPQTNSLSSLGR